MISFRSTQEWPYHISAGGVVLNNKNEVLLLKRHLEPGGDPGGYHLPKGTLEAEETLEHCALREIQEESGWLTELVGYLGAINRSFVHKLDGQHIDKTTHYFLAKSLQKTQDHDNEHDEVVWLPIAEALELLHNMPKSEDNIILRALAYKKLHETK